METTQMAVCKMEYYLAMKKNETSLFEATLLNLENVILKWSKSYRKRQIYMTSLIRAIWKVMQINLYTKHADRHRKQAYC